MIHRLQTQTLHHELVSTVPGNGSDEQPATQKLYSNRKKNEFNGPKNRRFKGQAIADCSDYVLEHS
jgi:hypothetical protein